MELLSKDKIPNDIAITSQVYAHFKQNLNNSIPHFILCLVSFRLTKIIINKPAINQFIIIAKKK